MSEPVKKKLLVGARIKRIRSDAGLTQLDFAKRLDVSPTYINLIERNQRPLSAAVLIKLAKEFEISVSELAEDSDVALVGELRNALKDPVFGEPLFDKNTLEDLVGTSPDVIKAFLRLHGRYRDLAYETYSDKNILADREKVELLEEAARPVENVRQYLHEHSNFFPELDDAATRIYNELTSGQTSIDLAIHDRLEIKHNLRIRILPSSVMPSSFRYFDRHKSGIDMSELLHPNGRRFQLAFQLGLLEFEDLIFEIVEREKFKDDQTAALARVSLTNYFAAALLMPYDRFLSACQSTAYDVDLLCHRFGTSFEQTAHRLTTLQRSDARGIPFFFLRLDMAGNVSKRFSAGRFHFSKFGGACPRWNIHSTFETPGTTLTQVIEMPDETRYVSIAKAFARSLGHHGRDTNKLAIALGCDVSYADQLVYFQNSKFKDADVTEIGVNCYLCDRQNCEARAHAPLNRKLRFNSHSRGVSLFDFDPVPSKSQDD